MIKPQRYRGKRRVQNRKRVHMENAGRRKRICLTLVTCGAFVAVAVVLLQSITLPEESGIVQTPVSDVPVSSVKNEVSQKPESKESITNENFLLENIFPNMDGFVLPSSSQMEDSSEPREEPVYVKETQKEILDFYEENTKDRENASSQGTPVSPPSQGQSSEDERVWLSDVPFISQVGTYPTGCESVSAVMACRYAGISISVDAFIDYLPRASFRYENGKMIGWHPNNYFMGDPKSYNGFGCYAPCIEKAIRKFLPGGYTFQNTTGTSLSSLCHQYIDNGIPVVVWATMYMNPPTKGRQWYLQEDGSLFQWIGREHCLVLTGYDNQYYYFNDPLSGKVKYTKFLVETRFSQLGKQSLVIYESSSGESSSPESSQPPESETSSEEPSSSGSEAPPEESSSAPESSDPGSSSENSEGSSGLEGSSSDAPVNSKETSHNTRAAAGGALFPPRRQMPFLRNIDFERKPIQTILQ